MNNNSSALVPVRFIALDSSVLGGVAKDYYSPNSERRKDATHFLDVLKNNCVVPFLCWHHFEELIKHREEEVVKARLSFLRSLPHIAWISASNGIALGSIIDLLVAECRTALQDNTLSALEVRNKTKGLIIRYGAGYEAIKPYENAWQILRPYLWEREKRVREIVAIRRASVNDIRKEPISSFLDGDIRSDQEIIELINQAQFMMAQEIQTIGDRRIPNPHEVASQFYDDVVGGEEAYHLKNGGLQQYLKYADIDINALGANATIGDMLEMIEFFKKLKGAHKNFNIPWERFKSLIQPERIPSWIITSSLYLHSQEQSEYKGSELNDHYLACLSPYVDFIYVDRRMKNDILRASRQNMTFNKLLNDVKVNRVRPYKELIADIES